MKDVILSLRQYIALGDTSLPLILTLKRCIGRLSSTQINKILNKSCEKAGPNAEVSVYNLKSVTNGMFIAQSLAVRTLQQLSKNERLRFSPSSEKSCCTTLN
ncbi:hypothetical protein TNIN_493421 [Trichonephila inaurata madagascariensis]|uniref:Uncharacterized protein n=1 Tax=Trichonephila inaurata madagascariensis TaxID=2747483 RepID=A0A8X6XMF2_9ARAC|nr:hypothetical protein TNIN_493421 [Trichonephila inaurata madagascariensis]